MKLFYPILVFPVLAMNENMQRLSVLSGLGETNDLLLEARQVAGGAVNVGATNVVASTTAPTLIASTITLAGGVVRTTLVPFQQTLVAGVTSAQTVPAGVIGLPTGAAATASASVAAMSVHIGQRWLALELGILLAFIGGLVT